MCHLFNLEFRFLSAACVQLEEAVLGRIHCFRMLFILKSLYVCLGGLGRASVHVLLFISVKTK